MPVSGWGMFDEIESTIMVYLVILDDACPAHGRNQDGSPLIDPPISTRYVSLKYPPCDPLTGWACLPHDG